MQNDTKTSFALRLTGSKPEILDLLEDADSAWSEQWLETAELLDETCSDVGDTGEIVIDSLVSLARVLRAIYADSKDGRPSLDSIREVQLIARTEDSDSWANVFLSHSAFCGWTLLTTGQLVRKPT